MASGLRSLTRKDPRQTFSRRWPSLAAVLATIALCGCIIPPPPGERGGTMDEAVDNIVRARLFCLYSGFHSAISGQVLLDEPAQDFGNPKVQYKIQYSVTDVTALPIIK